MNWRVFTVLALLIFSAPAISGEKEDIDAVHSAVSRLIPGVEKGNISPAPIAGLYEVVVGLEIIYMTADGKYIVPKLLETSTQKDLAEPRVAALRKKFIGKVDRDNMIIFSPKEVKHSVTVFTDIDCGYCRKLHNEVGRYGDKGIEVRYMFFPRTGPNSDSWYKAVSVWCSDDRQKALTEAKAGVSLSRKDCDNPIEEHARMARDIGLQGTPLLVLDDGRMVPGYVSASKLAKMFEEGI